MCLLSVSLFVKLLYAKLKKKKGREEGLLKISFEIKKNKIKKPLDNRNLKFRLEGEKVKLDAVFLYSYDKNAL